MVLGKKGKYDFFKSKMAFRLYLIFIIFAISLNFALAQVDTGCCSDDKKDNYCIPTKQENCPLESTWTPATCNQVSYCSLGCCVNSDDGSCNENVPQASCIADGNSNFYNSKSCSAVSSCQKGCCELGTEYSLTSKSECQNLLKKYYPSFDINDAWDGSIAEEYTCLLQGMQDDIGCCVEEDPISIFSSCSWTKRETCVTSGQEKPEGGSGFYEDVFCSNENLNCPCEPKSYKACGGQNDEDVYWFDSCGNQEDVVDDCNPFFESGGTLCKEENEDAFCKSVDCLDTIDIPNNPQDPKIGGYRAFGESWCSYESGTGGFLDRPGSRHYRHVCINGEELIEECKDLREEICIQGDIDVSVGDTSIAVCKNLNEFPKIDIEKFLKTKDKNASLIMPGTPDFNNQDLKLVSSTTVPVGLKFWSGDNEEFEDVEKQCEKGTSTCTVVYVKKHHGDSYKCEANCFCESTQYIEVTNNYCKAFGDCGADINILGKGTIAGISGNLPGNWEEKLNVYGTSQSIEQIGNQLENSAEIKDELEENAAKYGWFYFSGGWKFEIFGLDFIFDIADSIYGWLLEDLGFISDILQWVGELFAKIGGYDVKTKTIVSTCQPWVAPSGGSDCNICKDDPRYSKNNYVNPVLCSEYRCKSLGLDCRLVNEGTIEQDCIANNPNDVTGPVITPWNEIMESQGYQVNVLAGGKGYAISPKINPLEFFKFGVKTNEPARCRWDDDITVGTFEEMGNEFEQGIAYVKEHDFTGIFGAGDEHEIIVRCIDYYDNGKDAAPYVIQFNVENVPDFKPPIILDYALSEGVITSYSSGNGEGKLKAGLDQATLAIYVDEPTEVCRWSTENVPFNQMSVENNFFCGCYSSVSNACTGSDPGAGSDLCEYFDSKGFLLTSNFECVGLLTNVKQEQKNDYYISCVDVQKDWGGGCNVMQPAKKFTLESTSELNIISIEPENGTYYYPNFVLRAVTLGGADNGKSICYYNDGTFGDVEFFNTGGTTHTQEQNRTAGTYEYEITCKDVAGNEAVAHTSIIIDVDIDNPLIENIYVQGGLLQVITTEKSTCEYSIDDPFFSIGEGFEMTGIKTKQHSLSFVEDVYYIKCYDIFGNEGGTVTVYNSI